MSAENRKHIINVLQDSLVDRKKDIVDRFAELVHAATCVVGKGVLSRSRDTNAVLGRQMISYQMRIEGYSFSGIGRLLGQHHATIMHNVQVMEDIIRYRQSYRVEYAVWEVFNQLIDEDVDY